MTPMDFFFDDVSVRSMPTSHSRHALGFTGVGLITHGIEAIEDSLSKGISIWNIQKRIPFR